MNWAARSVPALNLSFHSPLTESYCTFVMTKRFKNYYFNNGELFWLRKRQSEKLFFNESDRSNMLFFLELMPAWCNCRSKSTEWYHKKLSWNYLTVQKLFVFKFWHQHIFLSNKSILFSINRKVSLALQSRPYDCLKNTYSKGGRAYTLAGHTHLDTDQNRQDWLEGQERSDVDTDQPWGCLDLSLIHSSRLTRHKKATGVRFDFSNLCPFHLIFIDKKKLNCMSDVTFI
jgi:hypothetical protein